MPYQNSCLKTVAPCKQSNTLDKKGGLTGAGTMIPGPALTHALGLSLPGKVPSKGTSLIFKLIILNV